MLETGKKNIIIHQLIRILLKNYGKTLEIVLTGRDFSQEMRSAADYVSEIRAVKHPFDTGTAPREGIEF